MAAAATNTQGHRPAQPFPMLRGDSDSDDDEAYRRRSRPTVDDLKRRCDALQRLPPGALRSELGRARHFDLQDLVIMLLAELRVTKEQQQQSAANSAGARGFDIDADDDYFSEDGRRDALGGATGPRAGGDSCTVPNSRTSSLETSHRRSSAMQTDPLSLSDPHVTRNPRRSSDRPVSRVVVASLHTPGLTSSPNLTMEPDVRRGGTLGSPQNFAVNAVFSMPSAASVHHATATSEDRSRSSSKHTALGRSSDDAYSNLENSGIHRSMSQLPETHEFRRQSGSPAWLPLRHIFFYQDYVSDKFSDGRSLQTTIDELRRGISTPATIPPLRVARRSTDGKYYSLCNRRLACYHYVFRQNPDADIPVLMRREQASYMMPQGDGQGVAVRVGGGAVIDGRLVWEIRHCLF
jgi:hypothetical protein